MPSPPNAAPSPHVAASHVRTVAGLPDDRDALLRFIREEKLVQGWAASSSAHFVFIHATDVDARLLAQAKAIAEALHDDVLQKRFPVDDTHTRALVIRVCKDREQYVAFGGPSGTSGYLDTDVHELVVYEEEPKKSTLQAMQSLLCAAHLFSALGPRAGHAWFRAGFEGWAAGHTRTGAHVSIVQPSYQRREAAVLKRTGRAPHLADLLAWDDQARDTARALANLSDYDLRCLSADLVEFLIASRDAATAAVPTKYYAALVRGATKEVALTEATQDIDLAALERAWLAF